MFGAHVKLWSWNVNQAEQEAEKTKWIDSWINESI